MSPEKWISKYLPQEKYISKDSAVGKKFIFDFSSVPRQIINVYLKAIPTPAFGTCTSWDLLCLGVETSEERNKKYKNYIQCLIYLLLECDAMGSE